MPHIMCPHCASNNIQIQNDPINSKSKKKIALCVCGYKFEVSED